METSKRVALSTKEGRLPSLLIEGSVGLVSEDALIDITIDGDPTELGSV